MHGTSLINCRLDMMYELAIKPPDALLQTEDINLIIIKESEKSHST
jgi:hypothetical protein